MILNPARVGCIGPPNPVNQGICDHESYGHDRAFSQSHYKDSLLQREVVALKDDPTLYVRPVVLLMTTDIALIYNKI